MNMPPTTTLHAPNGQLMASAPDGSRYMTKPADLARPLETWYVFDMGTPGSRTGANAQPPRTVAVCPGGAVDAQHVKTGLELLAELGGLIDEVVEAESPLGPGV